MKRTENHLARFRIERENAHARDHAAWASAFESLALAPGGAIAVAGRSDVMNAGKKAPSFLVHDDDAALRQRCNVRGAAAAGKAGLLPSFFDPVGVQVAEAVDLGAADETEVDPAAL